MIVFWRLEATHTHKKYSQERKHTNTTKPVLTSNDCVTSIKVLHHAHPLKTPVKDK